MKNIFTFKNFAIAAGFFALGGVLVWKSGIVSKGAGKLAAVLPGYKPTADEIAAWA